MVYLKGDLVSTPPFEIHTLKSGKDGNSFVVLPGLRGEKDYEADTFRVSNYLMKRILIFGSNSDLAKKTKLLINKNKYSLAEYSKNKFF